MWTASINYISAENPLPLYSRAAPVAVYMLTYRPDIDGLRAIAVLSVVIFHLGAPGLAGGYVGVDVLFVISGYLITSILLRELELGRFSLITFLCLFGYLNI